MLIASDEVTPSSPILRMVAPSSQGMPRRGASGVETEKHQTSNKAPYKRTGVVQGCKPSRTSGGQWQRGCIEARPHRHNVGETAKTEDLSIGTNAACVYCIRPRETSWDEGARLGFLSYSGRSDVSR